MKKQTIVVALLLLLAVFGLPAAADWSFDGSNLTTRSTGTVYGGVYVGVGDKDSETTTTPTQNHTSNYILPDTAIPVYARLYVYAWGGSPNKKGWINVSVNGGEWQTTFYNETNCTDPNICASGCGTIFVESDQTSNITSGTNRVDVKSTVFNGKIIRAVLVCAYNDSDGCGYLTKYWVNFGCRNLHYNNASGYLYYIDNTTTWFNGTAFNASAGGVCRPVSCAKLTTVYAASSNTGTGDKEPDQLYFNVIPTTLNHSPYYDLPNQLGDDGNNQYGVEWGDDDIADSLKFDLQSFDVTCLLNASNNSATFWRGHDDDDDGVIFHDHIYDNSTGAEGEAYVHPTLAVLTVQGTRVYLTKDFRGHGTDGKDNYFSLPLVDGETAKGALEPPFSLSGMFPTTYLYRYNPWTESWTQYSDAAPFDIAPGVGYQLQHYAAGDHTLNWTSKSH